MSSFFPFNFATHSMPLHHKPNPTTVHDCDHPNNAFANARTQFNVYDRRKQRTTTTVCKHSQRRMQAASLGANLWAALPVRHCCVVWNGKESDRFLEPDLRQHPTLGIRACSLDRFRTTAIRARCRTSERTEARTTTKRRAFTTLLWRPFRSGSWCTAAINATRTPESTVWRPIERVTWSRPENAISVCSNRMSPVTHHCSMASWTASRWAAMRSISLRPAHRRSPRWYRRPTRTGTERPPRRRPTKPPASCRPIRRLIRLITQTVVCTRPISRRATSKRFSSTRPEGRRPVSRGSCK